MRLIGSELVKLFTKRVFTICLVVSLCANVIFLLYTQSSDYNAQLVHNNRVEYESLLAECVKSDNPQQLLENKTTEYNIAIEMAEAKNENNPIRAEHRELMLNSYKESNPKEYANALKYNMTKQELRVMLEVVNMISSQLTYADNYAVFVSEMEARANEQMSFAIFAQEGSFEYNNIAKTPQDFEKLKGLQLVVGNNTAVETVTQFQLPDYLVLFIIILMCIFLFCVEREKGLYPILRSTQKGRTPVMLSKLAVLSVLTVAITLVIYIVNIFICGAYIGFGDMQRPIQSIELFMNCSLKVSILEYMVMWVMGKAVTFLALALLFAFIFVAIKTSSKVYAMIIGLLGAELFCYMFIDGNSIFSVFKYVNVMYLITGNNLFGIYCNVNMFNQPINVTVIALILYAVFVVLGIFGSCIIFEKSSQLAGKSALLGKITEFIARHRKIKGSVMVYSGEAYKHYKTSFAGVAIALLVVFAYSSITEDLNIVYQNPEEAQYDVYMQTLEGELTSDKLDFINKEQQYFDDLYKELDRINNDSTISEEEKDSLSRGIMSILESKGKAFESIQSQKAYVLQKSEEIGATPALINEVRCKRLTESQFREWKYFTLVLAVVIFTTANIFACEHKNSMINLIRCTKNGKSKLLRTKLFTVWLTSTLSFVLIYLPYMMNYIKTFGITSFNLPLAFMEDFMLLTSSITVIEYIFVLGVIHYIAVMALTIFVYMLSMLLKNNAMSMVVASGAVLIPCVVFMNNQSVRLMQVFKNDTWVRFTVISVLVAIIIIAVSLTVTFTQFNNIARRRYQGAHDKKS